MKFLKSLFLKIKAKKTLKTYQKPLLITILTMLFINICVILVGALIALFLDNKFYPEGTLGSEGQELNHFAGKYINALITCVKWMISANSLTAMKVKDELYMMILAIIIVVVGIVLFSGAIIATITTALKSYIDSKSHAKGKIILENHFVILNWNSKVPEMILNLMLKGFKNNIVILSNHDKDYIESEIKSLFLTNEINQHYKANLIIKEGDSLLRSNLEDISIDKASQVCIMARDDIIDVDDDGIINSDLLNLKIVLRLGSFDMKKDCQIVVETDSDDARGQMEHLSYTVSTLKNLNITPVSFNRKIGQIIAQSLVVPQMSELYAELFSFDGAEFYSIKSDMDIDKYMRTHTDAIPVYKNNRLFVLAEDEPDVNKVREREYFVDRAFTPIESETVSAAAIFIIGNNSKKEHLLENLQRSKDYGEFDFELSYYEKTENAKLIQDIKATSGPKEILILSDDTVADESYDANVFITLIELSKAFPNRENLTFITELLDSRNLSSIKDFNIKNTIISNKMMSLLITQIAMNADSKVFFERLLTTAYTTKPDDFDLLINRVDNKIEIKENMTFSSRAELLRTYYNTFKGKEILIGLYQEGKMILLNQNQDKKEKITLKKSDSFITIKYIN